MDDEIFLNQRQPVNALGHKLLECVLDEARVAVIGEARSELMDDAGQFFGLPEKQGTTVRGDVAAVEIGEDFSGTEQGKVEVERVTLCFQRAVPF